MAALCFQPGDRVEHVLSHWRGTVLRHVAGKDGGSYRVRWDRNGVSGLVAPGLLVTPMDDPR